MRMQSLRDRLEIAEPRLWVCNFAKNELHHSYFSEKVAVGLKNLEHLGLLLMRVDQLTVFKKGVFRTM